MSKNQTLAGMARADGGVNAANINGAPISGFRNKLINGNFDIWQRGNSQTAAGYGSDDRWSNTFNGGTLSHSRQAFALGQTDVPGEPESFSRTIVTHAAGAANFHNKNQRIEGVRNLAGKTATLTFYAKSDAPRNMAIELFQDFGSGGSPSAPVFGIASQLVALTTAWKKFSIPVSIPSIAGKTLGAAGDSLGLILWFDAGTTYSARSANLGQQSGTFDIARVSLVEGDATAESDPFSPRHQQQEVALCQRYYQQNDPASPVYVQGYFGPSTTAAMMLSFSPMMRVAPTIVTTHVNAGNFNAGAATLQEVSRTGARVTKVSNNSQAANGFFGINYTADAEI